MKLDRKKIDVDHQLFIMCKFFLSTLLSSTAPAQILSPLEPTAISVIERHLVSLVCSARGYPAVDITWRYQNTQLMDSDHGLSIQSVTEESVNGIFNTTSALTIPSVDRSDTGNYTCVASNTVFGSPVSEMQQFMLTVNCKYLDYMSMSDVGCFAHGRLQSKHVISNLSCYCICRLYIVITSCIFGASKDTLHNERL